uniref:Uncharacterized protein n=1 Tax=Anguilla anguilla TaxID=7936 RepID=A0A0E9WMM4_ANGAN
MCAVPKEWAGRSKAAGSLPTCHTTQARKLPCKSPDPVWLRLLKGVV